MKLRIAVAAACLLAAVGAHAAPAPAAEAPKKTIVHVGWLIAEPGKPVQEKKSVLIENGKVVEIRDGFVAGDNVIDLKDSYVLPGLIDMHTHVTVQLDLDGPNVVGEIVASQGRRGSENALKALPTLKTMLMNGFTTIRNLGDPTSTTYDLRNAIARGIVDGPRMQAIEPQFSVSGGDYDASSWNVKIELEQFYKNRGTCTGVIECRRAVREEVKRGADVIKYRLAALPFLDPKVQGIEYPDEVQEIIATAHKLNRKVATHTNGTAEGNKLVIEAGTDTLEHGPVGDEAVALMKKHGTGYTATLLAAKLANEPMKKMGLTKDLYAEGQDSARRAYKAGVMILFGSDLGVFGPERVPEEFGELVAVGLTPADALRAATINAATKMGMEAVLGTVAPGKFADLVAVRANPLVDVRAMEKVVFVMKEGKVFRNDNLTPTPLPPGEGLQKRDR